MNLKLKTLLLSLPAVILLSACSDSETDQADTTDTNNATQQTATDGGWTHPMTPWGEPDLQGMWPLNHVNSVPLQRSPRYGERLYFTEEELEQERARVEDRNTLYDNEDEANRIGLGHWVEAIDIPVQTSLIVDPPNGRLPARTELGDQMANAMGSSWGREYWDTPEDFDSWDRCITRGLPASMFPYPYNNGIEIVQAPGYVVINLEMIHEARIIPIGDMPALNSTIKQWLGDSRGRWEGNTLVVETTNFNGKTAMTSSTTPQGARPSSEELRMVERFERIADNVINYSVTVEDPLTLTQSWQAAFPWKKDDEYQFFEYACHEDNTAVRGFISNSRVYRKQVEAGLNPTVQTPGENLRERRTGVPKDE